MAPDPEHDGLPNVLEYSLDTDPRASNPLITVLSDADHEQLSFLARLPRYLSGTVPIIEVSRDLATWNPSRQAGVFVAQKVAIDSTILSFELSAGQAGERIFIRLRFSNPPAGL
jgi:hypothetical protein